MQHCHLEKGLRLPVDETLPAELEQSSTTSLKAQTVSDSGQIEIEKIQLDEDILGAAMDKILAPIVKDLKAGLEPETFNQNSCHTGH